MDWRSYLREKVRAAREALGLTMTEVARRSGLAIGTVSRIETGRHSRQIKVETARIIAQVFGTTVEALFDDADITDSDQGVTPLQKLDSTPTMRRAEVCRGCFVELPTSGTCISCE